MKNNLLPKRILSIFLSISVMGFESGSVFAGKLTMKEKIQNEFQRIRAIRPDLANVINPFLSESQDQANKNVETNTLEKMLKDSIDKDDRNSLSLLINKKNLHDATIHCNLDFVYSNVVELPLLHYCALRGSINCLKFLLISGYDDPKKSVYLRIVSPVEKNVQCDLDYTDFEWDPMAFAVAFGHIDAVKILEDEGLDLFQNVGVWEAAGFTHRNDFLNWLLSENQNSQDCIESALFGTVLGNNLIMLEKILAKVSAVNSVFNEDGKTLLHVAAKNNLTEVAEILIKHGVDVNVESKYNEYNPFSRFGRTPLINAISSDSLEMAQLLISNGAYINKKVASDDDTVLEAAIKCAGIDVIEFLINCGADVNTINRFDQTPLRLAIENNRLDVAKKLIEKGCDVNQRYEYGQTLLHIFIMSEDLGAIRFLISFRANINARDKKGNAPIHYSVRILSRKGFKIAKLLVKNGVNIEAVNGEFESPLCLSIKNNNFRIAKLLIENGANVNFIGNNENKTLLHLAAEKNNLKICKLLIENGADVNAKDIFFDTPLHSILSNYYSQREILDCNQISLLLLENGCKIMFD